MNLDDTDRRLLCVIEQSVPLTYRPYAAVGKSVGLTEQEVLVRMAELRSPGGPVRQIGGMFEATTLGYAQTLVAMAVANDSLDRAGLTAAAHPGVSHCYGRTGRYNLWFTLAVSPGSSLGMERTVEIFSRLCRAEKSLLLPTVKRYKLFARFMSGAAEEGKSSGQQSSPSVSSHTRPSLSEITAIRLLQADLPNVTNPFESLARPAGLSESQLLESAAGFLTRGWLRRYCAVLRHREVGMAANVLVAWRTADDAADRAGAIFSANPHVSHCYLRPAGPDWPYNIYTMIHGRTKEECGTTITELAAATGLAERAELWTLKEYRKARVELFSPLENQWEDTNRGKQ